MKLPNIALRAFSGIIFVGLLLAGILINQYTFVAVFALFTGLLLYEFYGLIEKVAKVSTSKYLNILGGLFLFGAAYYSSQPEASFPLFYFFPYLVYILVLFISELYLKRSDPIKSLAYSLFGQLYIALPLALTNLIAFGFLWGYNSIFILAILVIIWVNDTFAYLTGMLFGKHRMFERISPKKSWEGFAGGLTFAIIVGILFAVFSNTCSFLFWIGFSITVVAFGTWGDLVESLFKRTLGVKDSGNIIPGHGGVLDRLDSTILAIPAIAVYMLVFFKIFGVF